MIRRVIIAAAAALGAFSISLAFAANLGGLTPDGLGADGNAVSSCDSNGVDASYDLSFASGAYQVPSITVGGIDNACDGKTLSITVTDSGGTVLASASGPIPVDAGVTSASLSLSTAVSAVALANVHVAIS